MCTPLRFGGAEERGPVEQYLDARDVDNGHGFVKCPVHIWIHGKITKPAGGVHVDGSHCRCPRGMNEVQGCSLRQLAERQTVKSSKAHAEEQSSFHARNCEEEGEVRCFQGSNFCDGGPDVSALGVRNGV